MQRRENNFDIIRLFAAALVIISHSFGAVGLKDVLTVASGYTSLGIIGVYVFFIISGFLISQSFLNRSSVKVYFVARVLRIFPALIVLVLFTMFIFGPLLTVLSVNEYFHQPGTYKYLWNLSLIKLHFYLPGVFVRDGVQKIVNAPLWTLVFEFAMYGIVAFYGIVGLLRKTPVGIIFQSVVLCVMLYLLAFPAKADFFLIGFHMQPFSQFYIYFFTGALVGLFLDKIRFNIFILMLLAVVWIVSFKTPFFQFATIPFLVYAVFYVGYFPNQIGNFITKYGDFSYGTYLYGYLMQNIIVQFFGKISVAEMIIASFLLTAPFAFLSWILIERKALAYKKILIEKFAPRESSYSILVKKVES